MTNKTNLDAIKKAKSRADFLERILDEPLEKKEIENVSLKNL